MKSYIGILLSLFLNTTATSAEITIKGSDTLGATMVPQLTEAYVAEGNKHKFQIAAEGSSTCFTALLEKTADIGMSSRGIKEKEIAALKLKEIKIESQIVAVDMIAIVVNEKNPIKNLSRDEAKAIFTGRITHWQQLNREKGLFGKINVYTRNTSSGTYKTFQYLAMDREPYGKNTQKMAGSGGIPEVVVNDKYGISYVGLVYTKREGIKPLSINGIAPEPKYQAKYPLTRNLYFYIPKPTKPEAEQFIQWIITSPKAKEVISGVGFVPSQ